MAQLTVDEAAGTYEGVMRNVAPAGAGVCATCHTFIDAGFTTCYPCGHQPNRIDAIVPITYSVAGEAMHHALRWYKDGLPQVQRYTMPRLAAVLWRFVERHEACVAEAAGATHGFDVVTTVPSSTPEADEKRVNLRTLVSWCAPINGRYERVLRATGQAPSGREFHPSRYASPSDLKGKAVLLIDDSWVRGGHAQSAADAVRQVGAATVGLIVIGRHIHREYQDNADRLRDLPKHFDWNVCAAE